VRSEASRPHSSADQSLHVPKTQGCHMQREQLWSEDAGLGAEFYHHCGILQLRTVDTVELPHVDSMPGARVTRRQSPSSLLGTYSLGGAQGGHVRGHTTWFQNMRVPWAPSGWRCRKEGQRIA
jgi:hypothetical protein